MYRIQIFDIRLEPEPDSVMTAFADDVHEFAELGYKLQCLDVSNLMCHCCCSKLYACFNVSQCLQMIWG